MLSSAKRQNGILTPQGFTLMELLFAIFILSILIALAAPRLFSLVEFTRASEALNIFGSIRHAMDRCFIRNIGSYAPCDDFSKLNIDDPTTTTNSHFAYSLNDTTQNGYIVTAIRNTLDGGDGTSTITLTVTSTSVAREGTGVYNGIK